MYARSITFQARPGLIDQGIAYVRDEVMPAAMAMAGCVGLSLICGRESGGCIATSAWSTQEALNSSEAAMEPQRRAGAEIFGAPPSVEGWEIAVLHRHATSGERACVRCTWLSMDADGITHASEIYRMSTLPALEEMAGFWFL